MSDPLPLEYSNALRGDLRTLRGLIDGAGEWAAAARALLWFGQPDAAPRPTAALLDGAAGDGAVELAAHLARAAVLEMDPEALRRCDAHLSAASGAHARRWAQIVKAWRAAMEGDGAAAVSGGEAVYREASAEARPTHAVEATTAIALGWMVQGDIGEATAVARRASRMAQTEHLWLSHYFASVVLARLRRLGGRPHLAGLIASACLEVTAPVFAGWLLWERLLSGVLDEERAPRTEAERAWLLASRLVRARASRTDVEVLARTVAASAPHRRDLEALRAALSPAYEADASAAVRGWRDGEVQDPPPELAGLTPPAWADASPDAGPVAVAWPGGERGRRLLGFAVAPPYERITPFGKRAARPEAVAAALTLAGVEGVDVATLFEAVYGFRYRKDIHEATFKVERHRAKKLLDDVAVVASDDGRMSARATKPYAVPDPRCQKPLSDVLLRHLAEPGGKSARELAKRLDVPLRTVQHALKDLTAEGACVASKEGRKVAYAIEDTTFCEVTVA